MYRASVPVSHEEAHRALIYQLLWCLEYDDSTPRHRADTIRLCRRLGLGTAIATLFAADA